jgi:hypothetical protein
MLSSSRTQHHNFFSSYHSYYYVDHSFQHQYVITVQLLGLLGDGLINDNVLLQEISLHINFYHPQCSSFIIVVGFTVFLAYLCNFSISPLLQC